jgi:hypothetical protein
MTQSTLRLPLFGRLVVPLLAAAATASCGSGTLAILGSGGGGGGNAPTVVSDVVVGSDATDAKTSPVQFSFELTDAESNPASVDVFYEPPGGGAPVPITPVGGASLDNLSTSHAGVVHAFQWDFAVQVPTAGAYAEGYRLLVRTRNLSSSAESPVFALGNDAPVVSDVVTPSNETAGIVAVPFTLADSSSDLVNVTVEYQNLDRATGWKPATSAGDPPIDVATTPAGVPLTFFWNAPADEPQSEFHAILRFTPDDGTTSGAAVSTAVFVLDNNGLPAAIVNGSAFYATPDQRRGIPLPIRILDPESDTVRAVVQYRTAFGAFPDLPTDPAALLPILASPRLCQQYQIATEAPIAFTGRVAPYGASFGASDVRLPELASTQACIQAEGLAGRDLEILRGTNAPASTSAGWSANPLASPVGLLAYGDGHSAIVLDAPSASSWRLREIDLATGAVVRDLASGAGSADAIAWEDADTAALVATDAAGIWSVARVTLADGSTTNLYTTSGANAVGAVRGIVSTGTGRALVTAVNSLIAVDAATAAETVLASNFAGAYGIALDPKNANRLYVAERDWINPATSQIEGHVVAVDLLTQRRSAVTATGFPFLRPDSVAIDARSNRILVLTDANTADGTRELRAVDANGGGGGAAFQMAGGIPNGCRGIATGPEGLRMFAVPGANDLWITGGVEQVRPITAFDPANCRATVGSAFAPAIDATRTWKIVDAMIPRPASGSGIDHVYVWDSSDLVAGGDVVLRATPYDAEKGLATDTGVPRPVRPGLDVLPYSIGSAASTSAPSSIASGDFNGDGRLDLAVANVGGDSVSLFFQGTNGRFPAAPSATLNGVAALAPLTDPYAIRAVDLDGDGDLDLVSANHGSNNLVIWTQGAGGAFTTVVPSVNGLNAPSDVVGAELNGDGRMDLVVANTGANRVAIYFRTLLGTYPGAPSISLGNATTGSPVSVAVADLDRDGDLDIVSANAATNNVTIWYATAPGAFSPAPSVVLGGAGITDGPSSVAIGDLDGDGKPDIACANLAGNSLSVFLQLPAGGFLGTPTFTLATSGFPIAPSHLEITDVNGDGWRDLVASDGGNDLTAWMWQPANSRFSPQPIVLGSGGSLASPTSVVAADFDGDGNVDLAATNGGGNDVAVFQQIGGASYDLAAADVVLGSPVVTPNLAGIAVGDLDGDGKLDIVSANPGSNTLTIFEQLSPSVFASDPAAVLGSAADTNGPRAVVAVDLNGDGLLDIASANAVGGTIAIFLQDPVDGFHADADFVLGAGLIGAPVAIAAGDFDGDGRMDLVTANSTGNSLAVFLQPAGGFASVTPVILGSGATTKNPSHVVAVDVDRDGDLDLVCVNTAGNDIAVFLNPGNGAFPAAPSFVLGSAATTPSPRAVAVGDLDGDGDPDIAVAVGGNSTIAVFFQGAPGSFPSTPSLAISNASLVTPDTIAIADVDKDGDMDIVTGNSGSKNLTVFRQGLPGTFSTPPIVIGGAGWTDSPRWLVLCDLDGDGDLDLVSAEPSLGNVAISFGSH